MPYRSLQTELLQRPISISYTQFNHGDTRTFQATLRKGYEKVHQGDGFKKKNPNHWSPCGILRKPSLRNGMNVAHSQSILTQCVTKREKDCWERPPRHIWEQSSNSVLVASESLYQSKLFSGEEKGNPLLNAHKRDSKGQMGEGLASPNGSIFFSFRLDTCGEHETHHISTNI